MGFLFSNQIRALRASDDQGGFFEFSRRKDYGPYGGLSLSLLGGIIKLGASAIWLNREEHYAERDGNIEFKERTSDTRKGDMLLLTGGFRLTLPWTALPTLALKFNNVTQEEFDYEQGTLSPLYIEQSLDGSISITPQLAPRVRLHLELSYRDLTGEYDEGEGLQRNIRNITDGRRFAMGMELDIARTFFIRVGYGDGFGSMGLGFQSRELKWNLTTYGVDTTARDFRGKEDRRYILSLSKGL